MKVLLLSQGKQIEAHPGWQWALQKLKADGNIEDFLNIPYFGFAERYGWEGFYKHVIELTASREFDLVYFHYFHGCGKSSPEACLKALRKLSNPPIILTSSGDSFGNSWLSGSSYPRDFKIVSRYADITFVTQMGYQADKMISWGAKNVVLCPNSLCPVRFAKAGKIAPETHRFDFDVVLVGSRNGGHPLTRYWWYMKQRERLIKTLYRRFGKRFGLFGYGWDGIVPSQGVAAFDTMQQTFQRGRVVVGGNPYSQADYYSSNRVFFEVGSGIPTIELSIPRLDRIFRDGDHCYFCEDVNAVISKCEALLQTSDDTLYAKAGVAAQEMVARHTQYNRMKFKLETARRYLANSRQLDVDFPFFLPEVDLMDEKRFAVRER